MTRNQWLDLKMPFKLGRSKPRRERRLEKAAKSWAFTLPDGTRGTTTAHTKSEARAAIKRSLRASRLPAGTVVQAA
jgi:hypothetical protein